MATRVVAVRRPPIPVRARLKRHPIPIDAHFRECVALTYAVPADVLRPLLPPGLELETVDGFGFVAVALVQTESLRPAGWPRALGQRFFLSGYRVFTTFRAPDGRRLRGLRILRSDTDRMRMAVAGNALTHYNYHRCEASIRSADDRLTALVTTPDGGGDLEVSVRLGDAPLPAGSPFGSLREARRFAGPLPFTFDYEPESDSIVAIEARRTHWMPTPVAVDVARVAFFDQPAFRGCRPILAAAFHVHDVDYRWQRGVRHSLQSPAPELPPSPTALHGVSQILRFNWPFYAAGVLAVLVWAGIVTMLSPPHAVRMFTAWMIAPAGWWLVASLLTSWFVYDRSPLMRAGWIRRALPAPPGRWVAIHAGFDEMTPVLRAAFAGSQGRSFDIFDPDAMTEPSIARARRLGRAGDSSERVDARRLPLETGSVDAVFLLLSAHELRSRTSRAAFLAEVARVLAPSGRVIVAEHLRDWANFLAFGPGFLHFHSRRTWTRAFADAGLAVRGELSITPFVRVFILGGSHGAHS